VSVWNVRRVQGLLVVLGWVGMLGWLVGKVFGLRIEFIRVGDRWVLVDLIFCVVWIGSAHFDVRFCMSKS
jgi:hypothetical protein